MTRFLPVFLLLAGCATTIGPENLRVDVKSVDAKTYDMVATTQGLAAVTTLARKAAQHDAVVARATEVCAPAGFDIVAEDTPDLIVVQLAPRYRVRCR